MDRNALLDHLAQEMDHWPAPGSLPEPPIKGTWTCHGQWRCYSMGDNRPIEKGDWLQRRLALLNKIEKAPSVKIANVMRCTDGIACGTDSEFCAACPNREDNGMETTPNAPSWPEDRADHIGQNGNDGLHYATGNDAEAIVSLHSAPWFLQQGLAHMEDRAKTYDKQAMGGERSMQATVNAFVAITGDGQIDTAERGWMFMVLLKMTRSQQGQFKADNYEDAAAYCGLMGESAASERGA